MLCSVYYGGMSFVRRSLKLPAIGAVSVHNIFSNVVCLLPAYCTAGYYETLVCFQLEDDTWRLFPRPFLSFFLKQRVQLRLVAWNDTMFIK